MAIGCDCEGNFLDQDLIGTDLKKRVDMGIQLRFSRISIFPQVLNESFLGHLILTGREEPSSRCEFCALRVSFSSCNGWYTATST